VYNGRATVGRAIQSVLAQDFKSSEIIVVNDGSTDGTERVLEGFGSKIQVKSQSNLGVAAARNTAVAASNGDYLAFLDADDEWLPSKLSRTVSALKERPDAVLAFSDVIPVGPSGRLSDSVIGRAPSMKDMLTRNWAILPSAVVMRRDAFNRCGGFCEKFARPGGDDCYMWLLAREQGEFLYIPEPLVLHHRPAVIDLLDKYEPGRRIFVELVRDRYGTAAKALLKDTQQYFASLAVQKALQHLDNRNWLPALLQSVRALSYDPIFFAGRLLKYSFNSLRPHSCLSRGGREV